MPADLTRLTWEKLSQVLSRQFGEDTAQEVITIYLKKNDKIQHGIRYFRKCAKHVRLIKARTEAGRRELAKESGLMVQWSSGQTANGPSQLTRVILGEVWEKLPYESRFRLLTGENLSTKTSSLRVRQYRLRKKLNGS